MKTRSFLFLCFLLFLCGGASCKRTTTTTEPSKSQTPGSRRHYYDPSKVSRWNQSEIFYRFDPATPGTRALGDDELKPIYRDALRNWEPILSRIGIRFIETSDAAKAQVTFGGYIDFLPGQNAFAWTQPTNTGNAPHGIRERATVYVNVLRRDRSDTQKRRVLTHELGHCLGWDGEENGVPISDNPDDVMFSPVVANRVSDADALTMMMIYGVE